MSSNKVPSKCLVSIDSESTIKKKINTFENKMMDDQINVHISISLEAVTFPEVSGLFPYGTSIWSAQIKISYMSDNPRNQAGNQKSFMCPYNPSKSQWESEELYVLNACTMKN